MTAIQFVDPDDHRDFDDLLETATFAAETSVTIDGETFVVTMGGAIREGYDGTIVYSVANDGFEQ